MSSTEGISLRYALELGLVTLEAEEDAEKPILQDLVSRQQKRDYRRKQLQNEEDEEKPILQDLVSKQQRRQNRRKQIQKGLEQLQGVVHLQESAAAGSNDAVFLMHTYSVETLCRNIAAASEVMADETELEKELGAEKMKQASETADSIAIGSIQDLLSPEGRIGMDPDSYMAIVEAKDSMECFPCDAPTAHILSAQALMALGRGKGACEQTSYLWMRINQVENNVRDAAVWRCQLKVPLNDREAFRRSLQEAFGIAVEDKNIFSKLMQSQAKIMANVDHSLFISNSRWAAIKRGKIRGRNRAGDYESV